MLRRSQHTLSVQLFSDSVQRSTRQHIVDDPANNLGGFVINRQHPAVANLVPNLAVAVRRSTTRPPRLFPQLLTRRTDTFPCALPFTLRNPSQHTGHHPARPRTQINVLGDTHNRPVVLKAETEKRVQGNSVAPQTVKPPSAKNVPIPKTILQPRAQPVSPKRVYTAANAVIDSPPDDLMPVSVSPLFDSFTLPFDRG
jgi:hypothetical protein